MLLIVDEGIAGRVCYSIYQYAKDNNKYMKDYDKNKKIIISSILGCKQFTWLGNVAKTQFSENFIKKL